ncbi:hypothetical protein CF336_g174 [Tilletia laevis]|nr:hypothetical protein CF336_g174 [Tilletia laevis]
MRNLGVMKVGPRPEPRGPRSNRRASISTASQQLPRNFDHILHESSLGSAFLWCLTAGVLQNLLRKLCVIIKLHHEASPSSFTFELASPQLWSTPATVVIEDSESSTSRSSHLPLPMKSNTFPLTSHSADPLTTIHPPAHTPVHAQWTQPTMHLIGHPSIHPTRGRLTLTPTPTAQHRPHPIVTREDDLDLDLDLDLILHQVASLSLG